MILLDTHVWVGWLDPTANPLPPTLIERIEAAETLAISAITCWEVAWLHRRERITLQLPLSDWIEQGFGGSEVVCLPIEQEIAIRAALLPEHHRDPDRYRPGMAVGRMERDFQADRQTWPG